MEKIKKYLKIKSASVKTKTAAGEKRKSIHTSKHALAKDLSEYFHEEKEYKKYLGVCYSHSEEKIHRLFAEIKEESKRNFKFSPVKKFFWKLREIPKIKTKLKPKER